MSVALSGIRHTGRAFLRVPRFVAGRVPSMQRCRTVRGGIPVRALNCSTVNSRPPPADERTNSPLCGLVLLLDDRALVWRRLPQYKKLNLNPGRLANQSVVQLPGHES
jgi:hypothetical protein